MSRSRKPILRRTRVRRLSPRKAREDRNYTLVRRDYLFEHPLCQITIAELNLDEAKVLLAFNAGEARWRERGETYAGQGHGWFCYDGHRIPYATEIHHRNKSNGPRRCDVRFFMSASRPMHDQVEENKDWARGRGYLLPINANPNGVAGGVQYLTTPELLAQRAAEKGPPVNF